VNTVSVREAESVLCIPDMPKKSVLLDANNTLAERFGQINYCLRQHDTCHLGPWSAWPFFPFLCSTASTPLPFLPLLSPREPFLHRMCWQSGGTCWLLAADPEPRLRCLQCRRIHPSLSMPHKLTTSHPPLTQSCWGQRSRQGSLLGLPLREEGVDAAG